MQVLSIYRLFYLLGAVNALFFSVLIFSKKNRSLGDKILGSWLIILSAQLIIPFLYLSDLDVYYQYAGYEITFFVFHPVLLYFYIKTMIGNPPKYRYIIITIIPIVLSEAAGLSFFLYPAQERLSFIRGTTLLPAVYYPFIAFIIGFFIYYINISYKTLRHYKESILQIYSYRDNVDLLWLRRLVIFFSSIIIFIFPMCIISYFYFHSLVFADFFFYVTLAVFIFFLGYWGYQQGEIFSFTNDQEVIADKENKTTLPVSGETQKIYKEKATELNRLMKESKPYLNPKLTIHDLAQSLSIPPHQLSKIINKEFHSSFFKFVNAYRIDEFKQLAFSKEYKNLTILGIALECGFNSKSAFNRIFKETTGITPGDFIKHHLH